MRTIIMLITVGALLAAVPPAAAAAPAPPAPTVEYGAPDGTGNGGVIDFDDEVVDASDLGKLTVVL